MLSNWRECRRRKDNGERCGRVFRISRESSTKCRECLREIKEAKQAKRADRRKRAGEYVKPRGEFWGKNNRKRQVEEVGSKCEVCGMTEVQCIADFGCRLTRDHILPVRYISEHELGNPNVDLNIKMTCSGCCGKKTAAEVKLFNGDMLGFLTDLKKWGWEMVEVRMVLKFYGVYSTAMEHHFH